MCDFLRGRLSGFGPAVERNGLSAGGGRRPGSLRKAAVDGNIEEGSFMAGQITGLVKSIRPTKEIVESMVNEAKEILIKVNNRLL